MENKKPTLYYDTIKQHYCLEPEFAGAFAVNDSDSYAIYKENNDFIFRRVNLNAPKTLYHYCSFDTMLKITESNFMRLTSCYDSNDSEELTWALKVLINIVDNYKKYIASQSENDIIISLIELKKNINYILPHCPEELNIALNEAIDELLKTKPNVKINLIKKCDDGLSHILNDVKCILPKQPIHIACFSAEQDYLGQWRAYGDDGKGVAIGFDINFLHEERQNIYLRKVFYHENWQNNIMIAVITYILNRSSIVTWLYDVLPMIKHLCWKDEYEWRLIYLPNDDNLLNRGHFFRNNEIKYYYEFPLNKTCISEVVIGPKSKLTPSDVKYLLSKNDINLDISQIWKSELPYR